MHQSRRPPRVKIDIFFHPALRRSSSRAVVAASLFVAGCRRSSSGSLSSLSSRSISLRAHHGVFFLATAAHTFLALSQQQLMCFLSANYPFTRSLRSTSWNVAEVGMIVYLRLYSCRTKREAGGGLCANLLRETGLLVTLLNSVG
jgi:hypothetical protein